MYAGAIEQLQLLNAWYITNSRKWKKILDAEGGINISHTEPHSLFQNNDERAIQQLQRLWLHQMKLYDVPLQLRYKEVVYHS